MLHKAETKNLTDLRQQSGSFNTLSTKVPGLLLNKLHQSRCRQTIEKAGKVK